MGIERELIRRRMKGAFVVQNSEELKIFYFFK